MIFAYATTTAFHGDSHINIKRFSWHRPMKRWLPHHCSGFFTDFWGNLTFQSVTEVQLRVIHFCKRLGMVTQNSILQYIQHFIDRSEIKWSAETWEQVYESKTLLLTHLFFSSVIAMHFNMGSQKRAEKLKWNNSYFYHPWVSKQCLWKPLQDLSMQLHSTGCRHEQTKSCKHGHAWFTDLSNSQNAEI